MALTKMAQARNKFLKAPATLWAFAALLLIWGVAAIVLEGGWPAWTTLVLDVVFAALILSQVRLVWMLMIAGATIGVVIVPLTSPHWWLAFADALLLVLLLLPSSRRYMAKPSH